MKGRHMKFQVTVSGIPPAIAKVAIVWLLGTLDWSNVSTLLAVAFVLGMRAGVKK